MDIPIWLDPLARVVFIDSKQWSNTIELNQERDENSTYMESIPLQHIPYN